ncbi:hypothetical protein SH1V18_41090 [Vallitalea longa]|uniref:Uncharacterized protein n=1 Tax=Vallitalea longa TaxID=2936439 RepID=A0A9W5YGQ8_9FIRM|nr:lantibiotic dehydratase [Vallitalea longa]GKX31629.1 hypothetical protein SH1V18_41090 [Vallitalea longa]
MSKQNIFKCLDFFILRMPILSTDVFNNHLKSLKEPILNGLWEIVQEPLIREAIAVSSISLLDALTYLSPDSPERKREQVAKSLLRYLIRMSTRPTPFGLFSGVAYGEYGEHYRIDLKKAEHFKKRTRPDMEWLYRIIAKLENDSSIRNQLLVKTNTMAYEVGNRTYLPYLNRLDNIRKNGANFEIERTSISTTSAVEQALHLAKTPIALEELVSKISCEYPDTSYEQINQFVNELLKQELLISNLRPPLLDIEPFKHLLKSMESIKGMEQLKSTLQNISSLIDEYNKVPIGDGEKSYREIVRKMKQVIESKNYLQVDMKVETNGVTLPLCVKEEVEKSAEALWRISSSELGLVHMIGYKADFIKKYGMSREIPVLELLDEEIGLGAPATYEYPLSKRRLSNDETEYGKRKKYLLSQWLMTVLLNGEQELNLGDDKIAALEGKETDSCYAPRSFEMFFTIISNSVESMEECDFTLISGATPLSYGAGKSIGRFADIMGSKLHNNLKYIGKIEQELCSDMILAELVYLPIEGRAADVSLTYNNREYEINMGTTSSKETEKIISLSDLVVGIDEKGFYLRSMKLGKEVIAVTNHMLNTSNSPNIYRFIRELTQERQKNIEIFQWGELNSLPFLPRVKYRHCILSPARWILNKQTFPYTGEMEREEWIDKFNVYRRKWKLPRYIYLTQADNRLLLDLEESEHINEIRREFRKVDSYQGVVLTEVGHKLEELPMTNKGPYYTEFVFPIIKNPIGNSRQAVTKNQCKTISYRNRLKFPGSEWMFVKWYGFGNRIEEFLGGKLRDFCLMAKQNKWIESCFFMRYADPDKHIRIRFLGEPIKLQRELLPQLNDFSSQCLQEGILTKMVIDTYDPEIERYGGPDLINMAEKFFCIDSQIVMEWIRLNEQGSLCIDKDLLTVISIIDIMEQMGITFEEQYNFLDGIVNYKDHLDLFRAKKAYYVNLGDARNGFEQLKNHQAGQLLIPAFQRRSDILREYGEGLLELERNKDYYVTRLNAMYSMIHLHINRFYGIDRDDERRVLTLTRHTLHSLAYVRRR